MCLSFQGALFLTLLSCYMTQNLFEKFMPRMRPRLEYASHTTMNRNSIPLYMQKGPNPLNDYMANSFQPRYLFKRFHRERRQIKEDDRQFQDLLDSFGGNTNSEIESPRDAITEPETSNDDVEKTTTKSGFYFLLDWNSFLVLDDQNGKRVNLRIQPKVGNPKKFFSITVP